MDGRSPAPIRARDVTFRYAGAARPALCDVSFDLDAGAVLLVVGPSGSGKSTLGLAIAGLVPRELFGVFEGSLQVDGTETQAWAPADLAARVGIVFQDADAQLVMERVEDDVAFGLENRGWAPSRMHARVPQALAALGLEGLERRRSHSLSGGQRQRLALAGVLAAEPGILVLDEPTANLDPDAAEDLFARLASIRAARRTTMVLVEHHVEAAWPLADLIVALDRDGTLLDVGSPRTVLGRSRERMRRAGIWLPSDEPDDPRLEVGVDRAPFTVDADAPPVESTGVFAPLAPFAPDSPLAPEPPPEAAAVELTTDPTATAFVPSGVAARADSVGEHPARGSLPAWAVGGAAPTPVLQAVGVRYSYDGGGPVLRDIDLVAERGERIALVGPNGSGKSTLGRLLVGLLRPELGIVRLDGRDPARMPPAELARRAGYVFQDPESQFLTDRVEDEIMLGLRPAERSRAGQLAERLGLPFAEFGDRSPYTLSGGEARRLSLACILVRRPDVLVLDEPTFGQDRHGHEALVEILRDHLDAGACLFAVTHDRRFIADVAERIIELDASWLVSDRRVVRPS